MNIDSDIRQFYFLGIGGIGMSALARYFKAQGKTVMGYDRTPSPLTRELEAEGIDIVYADDCSAVEQVQKSLTIDSTLVVRTPAVPEDEAIYTWMRQIGFTILKRSEVLGWVTRQKKALCVAGTHGKTTTSTILSHIMNHSHLGTNAFLGGISNNVNSNLIINTASDYVVVEADEYDRSFHHLTPYISAITSIDPDHLDIYGTPEAYQQSFDHYASLVQQAIVIKKGFAIHQLPDSPSHPQIYTYSGTEEADFYARDIRIVNGDILFDFVGPDIAIPNVKLGVPIWVNIENSVAAMAMAWLSGATAEEIRYGVETYNGVYRRFNIHVKNEKVVYIDDYAHHPTELQASIESIRRLYPEHHFIVVFQPHLYTRTRDFADDFRRVLHLADELVLLPIYPARELPIPGVSSEMLEGQVVEKKDLVNYLAQRVEQTEGPMAVLSLGAGDIDRLVPDIACRLQQL